MSLCLRVIVHGRVQGVGFRYYTRREAIRLGLTGWVRNLSDGSVEAVINGDPGQIDIMKQWLNHGPSSAIVDLLESSPYESDRLPAAFSIR